MEPTDAFDIDAMLADPTDVLPAESAEPAPRRDNLGMLRKIPVTLSLEVGSAKVSLLELMGIGPGSVVELDRLAGEPLLIKVNGTTVGKAEVVVAGDNYGLKVVELAALDLDTLQP